MAKIVITDEKSGNEYTLEFDRASVQLADKEGYGIKKDAPIADAVNLFKGSLLKNHPKMKDEEAMDLFLRIKNKDALLAKLAEMYQESVVSLLGEPKGDSGNVSWAEK